MAIVPRVLFTLVFETGFLIGPGLSDYTQLVSSECQESAYIYLTSAGLRCVPPGLAFSMWVLGVKLRSPDLQGKSITRRAISPAPGVLWFEGK